MVDRGTWPLTQHAVMRLPMLFYRIHFFSSDLCNSISSTRLKRPSLPRGINKTVDPLPQTAFGGPLQVGNTHQDLRLWRCWHVLNRHIQPFSLHSTQQLWGQNVQLLPRMPPPTDRCRYNKSSNEYVRVSTSPSLLSGCTCFYLFSRTCGNTRRIKKTFITAAWKKINKYTIKMRLCLLLNQIALGWNQRFWIPGKEKGWVEKPTKQQ